MFSDICNGFLYCTLSYVWALCQARLRALMHYKLYSVIRVLVWVFCVIEKDIVGWLPLSIHDPSHKDLLPNSCNLAVRTNLL
jgi:hypothetical protein